MKRRSFFGTLFAAASIPLLPAAKAAAIAPPIPPACPPGDLFGTQLYNGSGHSQTIKHGLGWAPSFIMVKNSSGDWQIHNLK